MRGYGQYCPVAKGAEVVGDRWTLLILRELLLGAHRFAEIEHGLPGISRTLLTQRLRSLERTGVIERRADGPRASEYHLTSKGSDLENALMELGNWAARWAMAETPSPEERDPNLLMLWLRRFANAATVHGRLLAQFEFRDARGQRWLLFERGEVQVCDEPPGFEPDVVVRTDIATLHRVFAGRLDLGHAVRSGAIALEGTPAAVRAYLRAFGFSPFAKIAAAHAS